MGSSYATDNGDNNDDGLRRQDHSKDFVGIGRDREPPSIVWYIDRVKCRRFKGYSTTIENGHSQTVLGMMAHDEREQDWRLTLVDQSVTFD